MSRLNRGILISGKRQPGVAVSKIIGIRCREMSDLTSGWVGEGDFSGMQHEPGSRQRLWFQTGLIKRITKKGKVTRPEMRSDLVGNSGFYLN